MDHKQIEQEEIVERYVQHQLAADERLAFQEHYFACDQCFDVVQTAAPFIAGVREASRTGALEGARVALPAAAGTQWLGWFKPVAVLSFAATVLLSVGLAWTVFRQLPSLRAEIAREKQAREETERSLAAAREQADEAQRKLEIERSERAKPTEQIPAKRANDTNQRPGPDVIAQANIPSVTLESTRDSQSSEHQLTIPAGAKSAVLWIPVEPGNRFQSFRVQLSTGGGQLVETFIKTRPNRQGAVTVSVPTVRLQSQKYLVRIYGIQNGQPSLLGEYDLSIRKQTN